MAFTTQEISAVETSMASFMAKRRPLEEIRDRLDLGYRLEDQSVIIYLIRPYFRDPSHKIEEPIAKTTYNRKAGHWKIYCMRADMKWHEYPPHPEAVFFEEFLASVDEDEHGCFWG